MGTHFEKMGAAYKKQTPDQCDRNHQSHVNNTAQGNRFGYRGCLKDSRPSSTGISSAHQSECRDNAFNNNGNTNETAGQPKVLVSNCKYMVL